MRKYLPAVFTILGAVDIVYGIWKSDVVSLVIGGIMVAISLYIMKKEREKK
jgi:lipid-A-disaccharide synthase-like uncharacterized protein